MSEFKGTPGPWVRRGSVIKTLGGNERKVADVRVLDAEGEANAKLVEAAPELLEALKQVTADLWYQIEGKHGAKAASVYPSLVLAKAVIETATA